MIIGKSLTALGGGGLKPEIRVTAKAGALLNLHYKDSSIVLKSYQLGAEETQHTFVVNVSETAYVVEDATNGASVEVLVDVVAQYIAEIEYKLWLYRDGDSCEDVTGGWDKISSNCVITKNNSNMTVTSSSFPSSVIENYFGTINAINISGYKKLYADVSMINGASGYFHLGINDSRTEVHYKSQGYGKNSRSIVELDISNISGNYYINPYVAARSDYRAVVTVYKVWLK